MTESTSKQNAPKPRRVSPFWPLRWPMRLYEFGNRRVAERNIIHPESRYSFRMARYWFAANCVRREAEASAGTVTVVDLGCERGLTKGFVGDCANVRWVGLDWNPRHDRLAGAAYDEVLEADFDKRLPLEDASADVVICLHVLEHLPRPDFTVSEIARVLKPGGLLVGATPVKPFRFAARLRSWHLGRLRRRGVQKVGEHINAFCLQDWLGLMERGALHTESVCGGHAMRWKKSPLEGAAWWVRVNQFWGILFPSFGGELFIQGRKGAIGTAPARRPGGVLAVPRFASSLAMLCVVFLAAFLWSNRVDTIPELVAHHQDGNDRFYVCDELAQQPRSGSGAFAVFENDADIARILPGDKAKGLDSHFLVRLEDLAPLSHLASAKDLRLVKKTEIGGRAVALLGTERNGTTLSELVTQN